MRSLRLTTTSIPTITLVATAFASPSRSITFPQKPSHLVAITTSSTVTLHCPIRSYTTRTLLLRGASSSSSSPDSISSTELYAALHVLELHTDATDKDIKDAFVKLVKAHHPDLKDTPGKSNNSNNENKHAENDPIIEITKAYHLLKKTTETDRQFIINQGRQSHYTGGAGFYMNEEQYAKAQKAYYGRKKNNNSNNHGGQGSAAAEQEAFNAEFFNPNTFAGQERTKFFNSRSEYMQQNRARMGFDSPPWKVEAIKQKQKKQQQKKGGAFNSNNNSGSDDSFSKWQSLKLSFLYKKNHIGQEIHKLKEEVKQYKGFAGLDGSRFDSPASTARAQHKINQHPNLKQYILMTERAKERHQVDRAVGDIIFYFLYVVLGVSIVLLAREIYRSYYARKAYVELKEQEIMEGRLQG